MKTKKFYAAFFVFTIIFFMCLSFYAVITRAVKKVNGNSYKVNIDWEKLYPFEQDKSGQSKKELNTLQKKLSYIQENIDNYTSKNLPRYYNFVEAARRYEDFLSWNFASFSEYNPVIKLNDGYLSSLTESMDVSQSVKSTLEFSEWCEEREIKFFYVNLPFKICKYNDKNISGILDFSNQNADRFLRGLEENGVKFYDLREFLHQDGINHHEAFFVTDHHWRPETGLWAAKHILEFLRDDYGWNVKPEVLNPENFDKVIYHDWFLGSQGKKMTLARTTLDDISLLYPKFDTNLHIEIFDVSLDVLGDFKSFYNMKNIEAKDYYKFSAYHAYSYGDQPLIKVDNKLMMNKQKILIIHDSFSDCVIPFLALGNQYTDALDLRHFKASCKKYIQSTKPDVVIVAYNSAMPGRPGKSKNVNREVDKRMYDFR